MLRGSLVEAKLHTQTSRRTREGSPSSRLLELEVSVNGRYGRYRSVKRCPDSTDEVPVGSAPLPAVESLALRSALGVATMASMAAIVRERHHRSELQLCTV
jgi:hypothetical protein